jgi:hypothetical protein
MIGYKKLPHVGSSSPTNHLNLEVTKEGLKYDIELSPHIDTVIGHRKEIYMPDKHHYSGYLSLEDLSRCTSSNQPIDQPHAIIGVGFRLKDKVRVYDFFRHTSESKSTTGHVVASIIGIQQGFYLVRPWKDTPLTEWNVFLAAGSITINGIEQGNNIVETINGNGLQDIISMLPSISISYDYGNINVQLINPDNTYACKSGVDVYLESTTGLLRENRLITNDLGQASTELLFPGKGKIKAGFKFYSGKSEILIDQHTTALGM